MFLSRNQDDFEVISCHFHLHELLPCHSQHKTTPLSLYLINYSQLLILFETILNQFLINYNQL